MYDDTTKHQAEEFPFLNAETIKIKTIKKNLTPKSEGCYVVAIKCI